MSQTVSTRKVSITQLKKIAIDMLPVDSVLRKLILSEPDEMAHYELLVKIEIYSKLLNFEFQPEHKQDEDY